MFRTHSRILSCIVLVVLVVLTSACSKSTSPTPDLTPTVPTQEAPLTLDELREIYDEKIEYLPAEARRDREPPRDLVDWIPTGRHDIDISIAECNSFQLLEAVLEGGVSPQKIANFATFCRDEWHTKRGSLQSLILFSTSEYEYEKSRQFTYVKMRLENGKTVRGLIGVKDNKKRPLIIAVCGVMCEAGDRASRYLLMQLFDETPFHVLVLANSFTMDFVEDNGVMGLGGLQGADTVMRVARHLRNPSNPLYDKISDLHLFGLSLGGHEALMASVLNERHRDHFGTAPIQSLLGFCPVVDYQETTMSIFENSFKKTVFKFGTGKVTKLAAESLAMNTEVSDYADYKQYSLALAWRNQQTYQTLYEQKLEPWSLPHFENIEEAFEAGRFQNHAHKIKIPMLLWASEDDPVVDTGINTLLLQQKRGQTSITTVVLPSGSHCASALQYGWRNVSLTLQSFFLSQSQNYRLQRKTIHLDTELKISARYKDRKILRYDWSLKKNSDQARLILKYQKPDQYLDVRKCRNEESIRANIARCSESVHLDISLRHFPGFISMASNKPEAQAATRWLNVNVQVLDESNQDVMGTSNTPVRLKYIE